MSKTNNPVNVPPKGNKPSRPASTITSGQPQVKQSQRPASTSVLHPGQVTATVKPVTTHVPVAPQSYTTHPGVPGQNYPNMLPSQTQQQNPYQGPAQLRPNPQAVLTANKDRQQIFQQQQQIQAQQQQIKVQQQQQQQQQQKIQAQNNAIQELQRRHQAEERRLAEQHRVTQQLQRQHQADARHATEQQKAMAEMRERQKRELRAMQDQHEAQNRHTQEQYQRQLQHQHQTDTREFHQQHEAEALQHEQTRLELTQTRWRAEQQHEADQRELTTTQEAMSLQQRQMEQMARWQEEENIRRARDEEMTRKQRADVDQDNTRKKALLAGVAVGAVSAAAIGGEMSEYKMPQQPSSVQETHVPSYDSQHDQTWETKQPESERLVGDYQQSREGQIYSTPNSMGYHPAKQPSVEHKEPGQHSGLRSMSPPSHKKYDDKSRDENDCCSCGWLSALFCCFTGAACCAFEDGCCSGCDCCSEGCGCGGWGCCGEGGEEDCCKCC